MRSFTANEDSRLSLWLRVREFAVPPSMIELATARRAVGDWAGACAAARVDVDLNLPAVARTRGRELAARVRAELRHLAPDLLRWHMPRIAPDGLLRPGLTIPLARYGPEGSAGGDAVQLVARTPPAWADAGQRISLSLWAGPRSRNGPGPHPHPRPDRRFRFDLHRHLWDARRAGELRERAGAGQWPPSAPELDQDPAVPPADGCAVHRWAAEAAIVLREQDQDHGLVSVRLGGRRRLVLRVGGSTDAPTMTIAVENGRAPQWPVLPDAATWVLPDLELLHSGLIEVARLHPLVASALVPGQRPGTGSPGPGGAGGSRPVDCRGAAHRIGIRNGVLTALDHAPAEIRREELLAALGGTPVPCLRAIDEIHRHPESLVDIRARLDHGDAVGAFAVVQALLGPDVLLRSGALRDELETAALRRIAHGLYRAGLAGVGRAPAARNRRAREVRAHPRHARSR